MRVLVKTAISLILLPGQVLPLANAEIDTPWLSRDRSSSALTQTLEGLSNTLIDRLALGRSLVNIPWVAAPAATRARDGLGPLFNANTCVACHIKLGGGTVIDKNAPIDRSIVIKFSSDSQVTDYSDPRYGAQLAINAIHPVPYEASVSATIETIKHVYPDGETINLMRPEFTLSKLNYGPLDVNTRIAARRTPALIGLGLIEQIPEAQILQYEDVEDANKDGISGKANHVWSLQQQKSMLGRLGWKASSASTIEQTAKALIDDMGLTSDWFPTESCSMGQTACRNAYRSSDVDVPFERLTAISDYLETLRLPIPLQTEARAAKLFETSGCQSCHRAGFEIENNPIIDPYSDFLLHDMGAELSDNNSNALAREWRTAPLWGIGLAKTLNPKAGFLHDGRAASLEQAILWHGGEAESSKQRFRHLTQDDRQLLIHFLNSL